MSKWLLSWRVNLGYVFAHIGPDVLQELISVSEYLNTGTLPPKIKELALKNMCWGLPFEGDRVKYVGRGLKITTMNDLRYNQESEYRSSMCKQSANCTQF